MSVPRVLPLSLILLATAAGAAQAQDRGPTPGGPPEAHGRWDPAEMRAHEQARHAERAKALHDVLGIQPSQEAAFAAFVASMGHPDHFRDGKPGEDARGREQDHASRTTMTTPERLDRMKARMDEHVTAMRDAFDRRAQATKALYAALDPRQRAVMDALPELGAHGHGGGMRRAGPMGERG